MRIFQNFEPGGPRELIGRRHRALTVTGGLLVCLAAGLVIARASWVAALASSTIPVARARGWRSHVEPRHATDYRGSVMATVCAPSQSKSIW